MANKLISIIPSGTSNYLTPSLSFNRLATDLVSPGVIGAFTSVTGAFAVTAQGTPNMTVAVAAGNAYVSATPTGGVAQTFGVTQDASENVTIPSNSSGSTVYDFVYIKADAAKLNNPAVNGLDVVTLITSRSSTAYSASATANGNSNGVQANCLLIAVVTVANNAVSITSGGITDARVRSGAWANSTALGNPYKFKVYRNAAQSPTNGSYGVVNFDTKVYDTGSNVDIVTNKGRFTATVAGTYHFDGTLCITVAVGSGSDLYIAPALYKNGSIQAYGNVSTTRPGIARASVSDDVVLAVGDYVEVYGQGNNAGLTYDVGSAAVTRFSGFLVSVA